MSLEMRNVLLFLFTLLYVAYPRYSMADADPTIGNLRELEHSYRMDIAKVASALVGESYISPDKAVLRRWEAPTLYIRLEQSEKKTSLLTVLILSRIIEVAHLASRDVEICSSIPLLELSDYQQWGLVQMRCGSAKANIDIAVRSRVSSDTFEDKILALPSNDNSARLNDFWQKAASQLRAQQNGVICDTRTVVGSNRGDIIGAGVVISSTSANTELLDEKLQQCAVLTAFSLLGSFAIPLPDGGREYSPEMVQISYDPRLSSGMSKAQIIEKLRAVVSQP